MLEFLTNRLFSYANIENDTEIEIKPYVAEILPIEVRRSADYLTKFPSASNVQSDRFDRQSLPDHWKKQNQNKCEICLHEFCTATELNAHRGLIDFGSIAMDCEPTALDSSEFECDIEINKNQAIDDEPTNSKSVINRYEGKKKKKSGNRNHLLQNQKRDNMAEQQSDEQTSNKQFPCENCDRVYETASDLICHKLLKKCKRLFKCPLCDNT